MKNLTYTAALLTLLYIHAANADATSDLKKASLALAEEYSKVTQEYYEKHGEQVTISAGKEAVKANLKDPNSAEFKNIRLVKYLNGHVVCGSVNAKNSFGGYTGFTPFIACPMHSIMLNNKSEHKKVNDSANDALYAACGK